MSFQFDFTREQTWLIYASLAAVATHLVVKRKEPTVNSALTLLTTGALAVFTGLHLFVPLGLKDATIETAKLFATFIATLFTSIGIYRVSPWHPLAGYPGPLLCKLTSFWWLYHNRKLRARFALKKLHDKYGLAVRLGPNEISLSDPNALLGIHGQKGWAKAKNYDGGVSAEGKPTDVSLPRLMSHELHHNRRKIWDPAFTPSALASYHPTVLKRANQLGNLLAKKSGKPIDLHKYTGFFAYDVMNDLAFSSESSTLEEGEDKDGVIETIVKVTMDSTRNDATPWFRNFVTNVFPITAETKQMTKFATEKFMARWQNGSNERDIFYYLLGEDEETGTKLSPTALGNDAYLIVIGGTDTTSAALCVTIMLLTQYPQWYKELQEQLDNEFEKGTVTMQTLNNIPLLQAVIDESLRLSSAVASGGPRQSPPGGSNVAGYWFPEGTTVRTSPYVMHHDPKNFSPEPAKFRPDRWLNRDKEERFNRTAYAPFSIGPYGCVGKHLALQELRCSVSTIVSRFDAKLAPGFDATTFLESCPDAFFMAFSRPVELILTERKGVHHEWATS